MRKFLSYIIILVALVGIFGLVSVKQARADQCVLIGWTYASCHGCPANNANCTPNSSSDAASMNGSVYTGYQSTPAGTQETCTTGNTNMSQTTCVEDGGHWYPNSTAQTPPSTQEGVSAVTSTPVGTTPASLVGGMCTGQDGSGNDTPPGCNATVNAPGSTCIITNVFLPITCTNTWGGIFSPNSLLQLNSLCTVSGWSPQSCADKSGTYYPPGVTPGTVAQQDTGTYTLLAPLPNPGGGQLTTLPVSDTNSLGTYLNLMIKIFIGICAVLAVIMVLMGGIEYMTSELVSSKEAGKERIRDALLGLILALGAWTLLYTINPNLLSTNFSSLSPVAADFTDNIPQAVPANGVYANGLKVGDSVVADAGPLATLPAGVQVCASNGQCGAGAQCVTVGQLNCTSTAGLNPSAVDSLASGCAAVSNGNPCAITITGGTEEWLHSATTSHQPGSSTVDIQDTTDLDNYIADSKSFPAGNRYNINGVCYYAEPAGATAATTGNHWHVYSAPSSGSCSTGQ